MTDSNRPQDDLPSDLEARWEEVLHGRASPEEVEKVRREIANSAARDEFEAQAEVYAAIRGHSNRHTLPVTLRARLRQLLKPTGGQRFDWGNLRWATLGAIAATLVIFLGLYFVPNKPMPEKELFAMIAEAARSEYQRTIIDPRPVQTGSTVLERILGWFEPRVNFLPRVYFAGSDDTVLEGGRIGYIEGVKVPGVIYRWKGKPLVLVILPARENPAWSNLPRRRWVAVTKDGPTASVWRRGDFIYAIVGEAPIDKMREISRSITPRNKKF
jgi:anti-sigma factor RsiW